MQIASLFCVFCPNSQQGGASQSGPFWRMQCYCYTASVRTSFPKLHMEISKLGGAMEMMRDFLVIALPHECIPYYERLPWFDVLARVVQIRTLLFSTMGTFCHSSVWKCSRAPRGDGDSITAEDAVNHSRGGGSHNGVLQGKS